MGRNTKLSALADVNDHILDLEFQLRNTTGEDITITLHHPYFDFTIYDENGAEVYKHSKEYGISATLIRDEKVPGEKGFATNCKVDLKDKKFLEDRIYKVTFHASFEMKSEKKRYKLCDEAYFRILAITQAK